MRRELTKRTIGPDEVLAIVHGGTSSSTDLEAVEQFNALTIPELNAFNGVIAKEADGSINKNHIPNEIYTANHPHLGDKYLSVVVGTTNQFPITDYNSWTTYAISAKYGLTDVVTSLDTLTGVITLTAPTMIGTVKLNVNEKVYNVSVVPDYPATPVIISPTTNSTDLPRTNTVLATRFEMVGDGTDVHIGTDWEIATDTGFNNVVISSYDDTVNKTTYTFTVPNLNTQYYIRVRYTGQSTGHSGWSDVVKVKTTSVVGPSVELAILLPNETLSGGCFGQAVAINDTGTKIAVGAPYADIPFSVTSQVYDDSGAVYIFSGSNGQYTQESKIQNLSKITQLLPTIPVDGEIKLYDGQTLLKTLTYSDSGTIITLPNAITKNIRLYGRGGAGYKDPIYKTTYKWGASTYPEYQEVFKYEYYKYLDDNVTFHSGWAAGVLTSPKENPPSSPPTSLNQTYIYHYNKTYINSDGPYGPYLLYGRQYVISYDNYSFTARTYVGVVDSSVITGYTTVDGQTSSLKVLNDHRNATFDFPGGVGQAAKQTEYPLNMGSGERLGSHILMSSDSNELLVTKITGSAPMLSINNGQSFGSFDTIKNINGTWLVSETGNDNTNYTNYGYSVAASSDHSLVAVGNPGSTQSNPGDISVFNKVSGSLVFSHKETAPAWATEFGRNVVMSGNGGYIAIRADNANISLPAVVCIYSISNGNFTHVQDITTKVVSEKNSFGNSIAFNGKGDTLVISSGTRSNGSYYNDDGYTLSKLGSGDVYIYNKGQNGQYVQAAVLSPPNNEGNFGTFGASISINSSGNILAVGSPDASVTVNGIGYTGCVYIYMKNTAGVWNLERTLIPSELVDPNDYVYLDFGRSLQLSADGRKLAVGAPGYRPIGSTNMRDGAVFIFG